MFLGPLPSGFLPKDDTVTDANDWLQNVWEAGDGKSLGQYLSDEVVSSGSTFDKAHILHIISDCVRIIDGINSCRMGYNMVC